MSIIPHDSPRHAQAAHLVVCMSAEVCCLEAWLSAGFYKWATSLIHKAEDVGKMQ